MSVTTQDDRLHTSSDPAFRDAVTFAFGDAGAKLYGLLRLSHGADGPFGLVVLYAGREPVAAGAAGGARSGDRSGWEDVSAAGIHVAVVRTLEAWTVGWQGKDAALALRFDACSAAAPLAAQSPVARVGGMQGYEQLCRVSGSVTHSRRTYQVRCLGQRGQLWGTPDQGKVKLTRAVSAWLSDERGLTLTAVRPAKAKGHLDEAVSGFVFEAGAAIEVADPRLSTTYDGQRRQRRAGLELWMTEEGDYARRAAGEVLCETTLDLGEQCLDSAFFAWRMEGREGVGRYDVLRRANGSRGGRSRSR